MGCVGSRLLRRLQQMYLFASFHLVLELPRVLFLFWLVLSRREISVAEDGGATGPSEYPSGVIAWWL